MSARPRVVYATRSVTARVHMPGRTMAIIVVPDILCTRLTDPEDDKLVWNPKGTPFGRDPQGFAVDLERLSQLSPELVPDETHKFPTVSANRASPLPSVKHGLSMLQDVYKPLFVKLKDGTSSEVFTSPGVRRALYFCGYDWRQDNARSALRLAAMVDEALADTGERKVVLVGHGMGGQICRYYCRALGGESKVHELVLIGSATLGAPSAFAALKHGLEGLYVREVIDEARSGDVGGLVFECANQIGTLVAAIGATGGRGVAATLFGDLYLLLCLAAGHWLSRAETRTFVRTLPSAYQLMPGSIYCQEHMTWVAFDPHATGIALSGYMVPLPTMFELTVDLVAAIGDLASGGQRWGTQMQGYVRRATEGQTEGTPSGRATRNAMRFADMMQKALSVQARGGAMLALINWNASDLFAEFKKLGPPGKALYPDVEELIPAFKGFFAQLKRSFIDCRNARTLYEDPYTGLFDDVAERPLCAAHLSLAYRFDEVLTVTPHEMKAESLLDAFMSLLGAMGLLAGLVGRALAYGWGAAWMSRSWPEAGRRYDRMQSEHATAQARRDADDQALADQRAARRIKPRAYLPERTCLVYSESEQTSAGCFLQPLSLVSHDDANVVRSAFAPNLIAQATATTAHGDGVVPKPSARPEDRLLVRPIAEADCKAVAGARHSTLPGHADTGTFINGRLDATLDEFLRS